MKAVVKSLILVIALLTLISVGHLALADDILAPTITQISSTSPDGYYIAGDNINITIDFSEPVYTVGTTTVVLTSGLLTHCDFSISQLAATSTVSCIYTVSDGDTAADLDLRYITGDIYDETGNAMTSFIPDVSIAELKAIVIDTTTPNAAITTSADSGYYDVGDIIPITVTFPESVYTLGDITVNLNASSTANCTFAIASTTPAVSGSCNYTVQAGDSAADLSVDSISGDVYDLAGNTFGYINSNLAAGVHINTDSPRILEVTSTSTDGLYGIGDTLVINVLFSESVYTIGDITVNLNASSTANCTFAIASTTPAVSGSCNYTVQAGDSAADLSVDSISGDVYSLATDNNLVNFNIRDENIDDNSDIEIDGVLPIISTVRFDPLILDSSYNSGSGNFTITFSEPITLAALSTMSFDVGSCNFVTTTILASTATCEYTIADGYNSGRLYITGITGDIYDEANNHQTTLETDDIYFGNRYLVIDTNIPTSTLSNLPDIQTTNTNINVTVGGDGVDYYVYKIDGGSQSAMAATTTPISISGLSVGSHTLAVAGRDLAGNWQNIDNYPTTYTWTINTPSSGGGGGGGGAAPAAPAPQVLGVKIYAYTTGRIVKTADSSAVYHITDDGVRHLYPNAVTFWTWHTGTWADQNLETISQEEFDALEEGNHVTVKPDSKLIRFYNSPRVYYVSDTATISLMTSEAAIELYGKDWEKEVIKIQNGFESDYVRGEPLNIM